MQRVTFDELAHRYCERQVCEPSRLLEMLRLQVQLYGPDGWMLLECQMLDSSFLGSLVVVPFGPRNTFKSVPDYPVSPRGLASDMSSVVAVLLKEDLPDAS